MSEFIQTLSKLIKQSNVSTSDEAIELCEQYYKLVVEANKQVNLTRITSESEAAQMHFFGAIIA